MRNPSGTSFWFDEGDALGIAGPLLWKDELRGLRQ